MAGTATTVSIGGLAKQSGLPTSTLRYYEFIGLLPPPRRVSGRRRYDADSTQRRLTWIRHARAAGFSLAEVQTLFEGFAYDVAPATRWELLAPDRLAKIDDEVERLLAMKALLQQGPECSCATMDQCLSGSA
jgi:MerR family transcriptional regulator, redox-sensitive transcriptional activator SoxR